MFNLESLDTKEIINLNPPVLAFIGDGVYSLYIRERLVTTTDLKGVKLHNATTNFVKAVGQSNFIEKLLPMLNETELGVFKRARNHKTQSVAKNASIIDYKRATGLEALLGYLYLTKNIDRLNEILDMAVGETDEDRR